MKKRLAMTAGIGVLLIGVVSGALIYHDRLPRRPVPAASASVTHVAAVYLAAAKDHDCGLTRALGAPHGTWAWCDDPRLLSYKDVGRPYVVGEGSSPVPQQCVGFTMTTTGSSDGSMPVGEEPWSLCFTHTADGWRLYDQGQG